MSPAENLAGEAMSHVLGASISHNVSLKLLAGWEVLIGIGFFIGKPIKYWVRIALVHMFFTFTPLLVMPEICFAQFPFGLTITGQYIIKNLIFVGALIWLDKKEAQ